MSYIFIDFFKAFDIGDAFFSFTVFEAFEI